ncbi:hypothetical protein MuYL_0874 [Mucilaginibacter xinganensis]|uniref:Uncharacterized protein n=1 Tax=Mucilaginibacter xinganensis TaxID=1234841 RepID=A0A223NSW8_9SPHI|nr:hypothetical protein MuYL_0874 [Mucilaginibacter xinganensis]
MFDFFQKIALSITMQPGLINIFTKICGNIIPVQLKTREDKEPREVS